MNYSFIDYNIKKEFEFVVKEYLLPLLGMAKDDIQEIKFDDESNNEMNESHDIYLYSGEKIS